MEYPDLNEVARRPKRYWNVDGVPELTMGLLWMVWGGAWLFGQSLPHDWRWNTYWLLAPAFLALSGFAATWAIKRLKARLTFPRTGYVEWKEPSRAMRLTVAAVAMVTAMALAALVVKSRTWQAGHMATPVIGVILSLSFLVTSVKQRAPHFLALAGVALALGLAFGALQAGWESANWMFVILGAVCALIGSLRLARFLKNNPLPEGDPQ